jgi:prepilin-type N-terminal cleavage/methylation domain-containing protein
MNDDLRNPRDRRPDDSDRRPATGGWTLVELMVVIAIVGLLIGILVPALVLARREGEVAATRQFMVGLTIALTTYRNDTSLGGTYPPSDHGSIGGFGQTFGMDNGDLANWDGGELLTQALAGAQPESIDGRAGFGFRKGKTVGRSYKPMVETEPQEIGPSFNNQPALDRLVFRDRWDGPILYYRAVPGPTDLWANNGARFNRADNDQLDEGDPDLENHRRSDAGSLRGTAYVLFSHGPDGTTGTDEQDKDDLIVTEP